MEQFFLHLFITATISTISILGLQLAFRTKGVIDFSFGAILIATSYTSALLHLHFGYGMISVLILSFFISLVISILVSFLAHRVSDVYFTIGSLVLYMLVGQGVIGWESLTHGALGLSGIQRLVLGSFTLTSLWSYSVFVLICFLTISLLLFLLRRSHLYVLITGLSKQKQVIAALGLQQGRPWFLVIVIMALCATVSGVLLTFYYQFIDPFTFNIGFLIPLIIILLLSKSKDNRTTWVLSILIISFYEGLRFMKLVSPENIGFVREMIFGLAIIVVGFLVFRQEKKERII